MSGGRNLWFDHNPTVSQHVHPRHDKRLSISLREICQNFPHIPPLQRSDKSLYFRMCEVFGENTTGQKFLNRWRDGCVTGDIHFIFRKEKHGRAYAIPFSHDPFHRSILLAPCYVPAGNALIEVRDLGKSSQNFLIGLTAATAGIPEEME